jgi:hypothetical protein
MATPQLQTTICAPSGLVALCRVVDTGCRAASLSAPIRVFVYRLVPRSHPAPLLFKQTGNDDRSYSHETIPESRFAFHDEPSTRYGTIPQTNLNILPAFPPPSLPLSASYFSIPGHSQVLIGFQDRACRSSSQDSIDSSCPARANSCRISSHHP